jgi:phospholipid transport system substrate-binding protein
MLSIGLRAAASAALLALVAASSAQTPAPNGPLQTVKLASDRIVAILSDPKVSKQERWTQIAPIIAENFNFRDMSQSVLSRQWQSATPEQQRQFVEYFSQYIEATYRSKIEAYSGQRIEYTDEKIRDDRAAVSSIIHTDTTQIPVGYYLRRGPGGEWKAYDVTVEGVSLVNSYRDTYAAISASSGISGVLAHVKRRAEEEMKKSP